MATFTKRLLSGSTNGQGIAVAAIGSPGTLIHTAVSGISDFDEIWIYVANLLSAEAFLVLQYGDTTTSTAIDLRALPEAGLILVIPGLVLNNSKIVRAFASTGGANVMNIFGYVNRITT